MPQRKGRILEIMELRRMRTQIAQYKVLAFVVTRRSPGVGLAFAAAYDALERQCDAMLDEMMEWWNPQGFPSNPGRTAETFTDDELRASFRFDRDAIAELRVLLNVPDVLYSRSKRRFGGEEAFLLLLRRLGGRERNVELAQVFGRSSPAISEMYNVVLEHVYEHARAAMRLELWERELEGFADVLAQCGCVEQHCVGFIDGTMFAICRPVDGQESMYNGWKRGHRVKYQCVVLPNFLIGDWHGPAAGRTNDSQMLVDSNLVPRMREICVRVGRRLCIYGDAAYPTTDVLLRAPKRPNRTPAMEQYATLMSQYRECVEWVFGKIGNLWPFVTDVTRKTTGSRATSKEDWVAALLTNYHTCRYGGVANSYFNTRPPTMRQYRTMYSVESDEVRAHEEGSYD